MPPQPTIAHRRTAQADAGLIFLTLIWGVNFAVIKAALDVFEPMAFNGLRFPLAALVLWIALRARGGVSFPEPRDLFRILFLGILGNVAYQLLFIVGIDRTLAGNASLMLATSPVWTVVIAAALGVERSGAAVWAGVFVTLVGMVLVAVGGGQLGGSVGVPVGDVLLVVAAMCWALYTVLSQDLTRKYGALALTAWTLWIGSALLFIIGLPDILDTDLRSVPPAAWVAVLYAGVFAVAIAYLLWYRGVKLIGSSRTAAYSNLVPVVALVAAGIVLNERPAPLQLTGAAVVIAGVWLARSGRPRMPGPRPLRLPPSRTEAGGGGEPRGTRRR